MRFIFGCSSEMNDLRDGGMKGEGCSVLGNGVMDFLVEGEVFSVWD